MERRVVCISHATGAGGSEIGRLVAERLGFRYIDAELVAEAAAKGGVDPGEIASEERRKSLLARLLDDFGRGTSGEAWSMSGFVPPPVDVGATSDDLRVFVQEAIEEAAARGDVVLVSHAASHTLGRRGDALRVLVTASPETRAARLREAGKLDELAAAHAVEEGDAARADYLKRFHGVREEQPTQYDLVLNTDQLSLEQAAELVSAATSAEL